MCKLWGGTTYKIVPVPLFTGSRGNHVFNSRLLQLAVKSKSGRCGIGADLTSALIARQELWRIVGFRRSIYFVPAFKVYTDPLLSFPGE